MGHNLSLPKQSESRAFRKGSKPNIFYLIGDYEGDLKMKLMNKVVPRDFVSVKHFIFFQTARGKFSGKLFFFHPFKRLRSK